MVGPDGLHIHNSFKHTHTHTHTHTHKHPPLPPKLPKKLLKWVAYMVGRYGFDGLRVDTAPEAGRGFLPAFASAAGVFTLGEVWWAGERPVGRGVLTCSRAPFDPCGTALAAL